MSRNRLEDIGRMMGILEALLEHPLFLEDRMDPKDFPGWVASLDLMSQLEVLSRIGNSIGEIEETLRSLLAITKAEDHLNGSRK